MMKLTERYTVVCVTLLAVCGFVLQAQAQEKLISKLFDFVDEAESVEWVNESNAAFAFAGAETNAELATKRETRIDSGDRRVGEIDVNALYMRAAPRPGSGKYGVKGRKVVQLPEKHFIQFQAGLALLDGWNAGAKTGLQVETRDPQSSEWTVARTFEPVIVSSNREDVQPGYFKADLSEWSGQEVRLSLLLDVEPAVVRVGNIEQFQPDTISAEFYMAKLVSSTFKVTIGNKQPVESVQSFKTVGNGQLPSNRNIPANTTIVSITANSELVLEGKATSVGKLVNPSDAEIATLALPADGDFPARFVCYFTSKLAAAAEPHGTTHSQFSTEDEYGASTRMIDFAYQSGTNMYQATVQNIRDAVHVDGSNNAIAVLIPGASASEDFDNHYAGITSAIYANLSNGSKTVHAFFYGEDHFKDDDSENHNSGGVQYAKIGYARSVSGTHSFGQEFSKTSHSGGKAIITDASPYHEDEIADHMGDRLAYGVGGPSVFPIGDYYYMIYHSWTLVINQMTGLPDVNGNGNYASAVSLLCAARALKSEIESTSYSSNNNPWKKFKEVISPATHANNFVQPGDGGAYSGIWNVTPDISTGFRTNIRISAADWRSYPKVSYNSYLDRHWEGHQALLVATGGITINTKGFWIHTSSNLLDWDDGLLILEDNGGNKYEYPTIVGGNDSELVGDESGYDGQTANENKLYYFLDRGSGGIGDLYRTDLTITAIDL